MKLRSWPRSAPSMPRPHGDPRGPEISPFLIDIFLTAYNIIMMIGNIAIEHGPVEIVDLPINKMVELSIVMWQFTRGYPLVRHKANWIDPAFFEVRWA